jgi:hypothetical protein
MPVHYRNLKGLLHDPSGEERDTLMGLLKKVRSSMSHHSEPAVVREG